MSSQSNNINENSHDGNEKTMMQNLIEHTKEVLIEAKDILTYSESEQSDNVDNPNNTVDEGVSKVKDNTNNSKENIHETGEKLEDKATETTEDAKDKASISMDEAHKTGEQAENKIKEWSEKVNDKTTETKTEAEQNMNDTKSSTSSLLRSAEDRARDQPVTKDVTHKVNAEMDSDNYNTQDGIRGERQKVPSTLEALLSTTHQAGGEDVDNTTDAKKEETKDNLGQIKEQIHAAGEKIEDKTKVGAENAREWIHDKTKSKDEKEAEKPLHQKIDEHTPDSAQEAGAMIGSKIDEGFDNVKNTFGQEHYAQ
jgi:ElaB/YqjD/DUF883 family membrane-anchored ribosome-binding protein